jgi:hypothetical protein
MRLSLPFLLLLAACNATPDRTDMDARDAGVGQNDFAGAPTAPQPKPSPTPVSVAVPVPVPSPPPSPPDAAAPPDSPEAAADVVRRYFAALEAHDYAGAWRLWDRDGDAAGLDQDAFAARFAPYAEYHAEIGKPGRVDAGAGQRYVTVPVWVFGTLKRGGTFRREGSVTLHRVAEVPGASAEARMWRLRESNLDPQP